MQIAPAGDRALLVTLPGVSAARLRDAARRAREIDGVVAAIIGQESIYIVGTTDRDAARGAIEEANETATTPATQHTIEVSFVPRYALDLDALLARTALDRETMIARIADITLTARYLGFRAGFAYLEGWPADWTLPRRPTSRNVVPGGSFATAGAMAGFYPVDSPGGWNILGRAISLPRILPGDEIRIVPTDRAAAPSPPPQIEQSGEPIGEVITPGQLTTVVGARDWSRALHGDTPGGPFDIEAASLANEAAGNRPDAPLLECVLVGPSLRFQKPRRVAWCSANCEPRAWTAADINIGRMRDGLRGYLAVEGGALGEIVRGGRLWSAAAELPLSKEAAALPPHSKRKNRFTIRVKLGPHDAPPLPHHWDVTPNMNRVGVRLSPASPLEVRLPTELPSCGMQFGTMQWHPDGSIVVMGPDHPVTGGYLQPATVISSELWKIAQLAPGDRIHLVAV